MTATSDAPKREAEFITPLLVRICTDDLAILTADFGFYSAVLGHEHWVRRGKPTDFASVPRRPGAYWLAGGRAKWEAVGHDDLCDKPAVCDRATADRVFVELMGVSAEFVLEEGWETDQIRELHEREPTNQRLDDVRINADGSVTVFKRAQKSWRRNLMGAGVRIGAAWDDFKRRLGEPEEANQEAP